jgi:hypothetical protein
VIVHLLASSCFPNCHPPGQTYTTLEQTGNAGLGLALILGGGLIWASTRRGKK